MKLRFGPYTVETSNDDKVLFPDAGITKADVVAYYRDVAPLMRPHLDDRCLTLHRFPDGVAEPGFYQQNRSKHFPDFVGHARLPTADGDETVDHVVVRNQAGLAYLADQGTVTFHGWLSRASKPRCPDRVVFDLDPPDGGFRAVVDCARALREALEICGLEPFVMTTGSRGLHVIAPLAGAADFDATRAFARTVAEATAARAPERFTTRQRKAARGGRLYIDIARNAYGQTAVLPYSLRALEGAPVATPLDWSELGREGLSPRRWRLGNLARRLGQKDDPFAGLRRHARRWALDEARLARWREGGGG